MLDVLFSIAPVFLILVIGHLLRRYSIPSTAYWEYADKLVYWLLFPALLFHQTSTMQLSLELVGPLATVLLGGFAMATLASMLLARAMRLDGPAASSVMQGAARHNTFIALAVVERLYGSEALGLASLATAMLVPVTNVVIVSAVVVLVRPGGRAALPRMLVRELLRNPLIIAIVLGFLVNVAVGGRIPVVNDTAKVLGAAALPVVLLCVGASLRIREMQATLSPILLSSLGKLLVFPLGIVVLCRLTGLGGTAAEVALVYGSVPTASSAYALARQMGGDAPLMAAIITVQTLVTMVTMPITIVLGPLLLPG